MTTQTIEIPVKGMDCADCVKHVHEAITALPGVSSANVLLSSERAIIQLDPQRVDLPMLAKAVANAGYSVPETIADAPPPARTFGDTTRPVLTIFGIVFCVVLFVVVVGEWMGLFEALTSRVPWPIGAAIVVAAGYPIFRKGELLGLQWSSIDYENQLFTVDQQVRELDGGCKLIPPKSEAAKRVLPLTPYLIEMLRDLWGTQQAERLHCGLDWHEHGLVFPAENGNPKIPSNLLREYKRILTAAEIDAETRLHHLRHTAATRAGENGMEEYVVAAMLGHGKKNVTRRYTKAMADQMRPAILLAERKYLDGSARKAGNS